MKILKLSFENLNSLKGKWSIDFTDPAFDAGIFAITGPTGSGKTTILDAVCVALYGRTPRLGAINNTQDELMNRQSSTCSAELTFETESGIYRSGWSHSRVKRGQKNPFSAVKTVLDKLDGKEWVPVAEKVGEKNAALVQIIGLTFEQFTRSVLLAQGSFSVFLKAAKEDKASTLEQITGTEIYSQISRNVFLIHKERAEAIRLKEQSLGDLASLTSEERAALQSSLRSLQAAFDGLEKESKVMQEQIRWKTDLAVLRKEVSEAQTAKENLKAKESEIAALGKEKELAGKALSIEPAYRRMEEAQKRSQRAKTNLEACEKLLKAAQMLIGERTEKKKAAEVELTEFLASKEASEKLFSQVEALDTRIQEREKELLSAQKKVEDALFQRTKDQEASDELSQKVGTLKAALEEAAEKISEKSAYERFAGDDSIRKLVDQKARAEARQSERASLIKESQNLSTDLNKEVRSVSQTEGSIAALEGEIKALKAELETFERQSKELLGARTKEDVEKEAEAALEREHRSDLLGNHAREFLDASEKFRAAQKECTALLETQKASEAELSKTLELAKVKKEHIKTLEVLVSVDDLTSERSKLEDGKPCPLCGALHHPFAEHLPAEVARARAELKEAQDALEKLREEEGRFKEEVAGLRGRLNEQEKARGESSQELERIEPHLKAALGGEGIQLEPRETLIDRIQAHRREAENVKKTARSILKNLGKLTETARLKGDELIQKVSDADKERIRHENAAVKVKELENKRTELAEKLKVLDALDSEELCKVKELSLKAWEELDLSDKNASQCFETLLEAAQELRALKTQRKDHESRLSVESKALEAASENLVRSLKACAAEEAVLKESEAARKAVRDQREALFGQKVVSDERRALKEAEAQKRKSEQDSAGLLTEAKESLASAASKTDAARLELTESEGLQVSLTERWLKELPAAGFESELLWQAALKSSEWVREAERKISQYQNSLSAAAAVLQSKTQKLEQEEAKNLTDLVLNELEDKISETEAKKREAAEEMIKARTALAQDDEKKKRSGALQEEIERLREENRIWSELNELIGSSKGEKYKAYVQGLTLKILLSKANEELQKFKSRYYLLPGDGGDLSISVIDTDLAGVTRPTTNLSGGESFIVSLALSLGLSRMASKNVRIDSLFLDEGFGTLDERSLETALGALGRLNSAGKLVGIISHVALIGERIPVRIEVSRTSEPGVGRIAGAGVSSGR